MGYAKRQTVTITTDSSGDGTGYTTLPVNGVIHSIQYVKTDYADGVDFTITGNTTGMTIWAESNVNASAVRAVKHPAYTTAGAAMLHASGGTAVPAPVAVADETIKVVVASGGDTKTGTFHIVYG